MQLLRKSNTKVATAFGCSQNWDHLLLYEVIAKKDKQSQLLIGCGVLHARFSCYFGFQNLHGIDLKLRPNKIAATYLSTKEFN